jgi:hypothetical protein
MGRKTGRHRRHIPYGSKGYCGYGGEIHSKHGNWIDDVVDKRACRQMVRNMIRKICIDF